MLSSPAMGPAARFGPFRGLAPFQQQDEQLLFGRDAARARIKALLRDPDARLMLFTGELATGKTSLLLAGLMPFARNLEMLPIYVDVGEHWELDLRASLGQAIGRALEPGDDTADVCLQLVAGQSGSLVLIFDHLEQLIWLQPSDVARLQQLIGVLETSPAPVRIALSIDRDAQHVLGRLVGMDRRIPSKHRVEVGGFNRQQASSVIEQTVLAGGGYMEAGLPDLIAEDLCADGPALPAELQRVCHAAVLERRLTRHTYRREGGAEVLDTLYVQRLAARAGGWRAHRVLAVLVEGPNPRTALSLDVVAARAGMPHAAAETLAALEQVGLVREVGSSRNGGSRSYALLHPQLYQSTRDLVAPVRQGRARARLALRWRMESKGLLRPHELFRVWRYLGAALSDQERATVQRSWRSWAAYAGVVLAVPLLLSLVIWLRMANSTFLDVADLAGAPSVVLRTGDPSLSFARGWTGSSFGEIRLDTGLALGSLPRDLQQLVARGGIKGDLGEQQRGVSRWLAELVAPLPAVRRGALLILAGRVEQGAKLLAAAAQQPKERRRAAQMLVLLIGDSSHTRDALLACVKDARPEVRMMAVQQASRLGSSGALSVLRLGVADADPQVRLVALESLAQLDPGKALQLLGPRLLDGDRRVQSAALGQLQQAVKSHPLGVFDLVLPLMSDGPIQVTRPIGGELERLQQRIVRKVPRRLAQHLVERLEKESKPERRVALLRALVPIADSLGASILPTVERLVNDSSIEVRVAAIGLQARFGDSAATMERLDVLARTYHPRKEAVAIRRAAALGYGLVSGGDDEQRLRVLKQLLLDGAPSVRAAAVASLLGSGPGGASELLLRIRRGYPHGIAEAVLDAVCSSMPKDRRLVTTIAAAVWKKGNSAVRKRALACAEAFESANPRLSRWLADQATVADDASVRRAAAPAVALALQRSGARLARLPLFFLRDKDPTVQVAMLKALAAHPAGNLSFLLPTIGRLTKSPDSAVRAATTRLAVVAAPVRAAAGRVLQPLLTDKEPVVWRAALIAARRLADKPAGDAAAWTPVRAQLDHTVADLLSQVRDADALTALDVADKLGLTTAVARATHHAQLEVRAAAVERFVAHTKPESALKVLEAAQRDSELALRLAATRAIARESGRLGADAVRLLARRMRASDVSERWATFEALGRAQGAAEAGSLALLLKAARSSSEERRRLAMRALGQLAKRAREAASALVNGALDPAHDVRVEARAALSRYLGRASGQDALWRLLTAGERNALVRRVAVAALAWRARVHGVKPLRRAVDKLGKSAPLVIRMAGRMALALAGSRQPPERVIGWLWGW